MASQESVTARPGWLLTLVGGVPGATDVAAAPPALPAEAAAAEVREQAAGEPAGDEHDRRDDEQPPPAPEQATQGAGHPVAVPA